MTYNPFKDILIAGGSDFDNDLKRTVLGKNPKALQEFYKFCAKEFSTENLLCLLAIAEYKKFPSFIKRNFILEYFVDEKAEKAVNISSKARQAVNAELIAEASARRRRNAVNSRAAHVTPSLPVSGQMFSSKLLENDLWTNLADSFSRYSGAYMSTSSKFMGSSYINKRVEEEISKTEKIFLQSMVDVGFYFPLSFLK